MLSFSKLESFLTNKGYTPCAYYAIDKECVFVEVISRNATGSFLIYIPSKYTIKVDSIVSGNVYNLVMNDLNNNISDDTDETLSIYDKIDLDDSLNSDNKEDTLEDIYKRSISDKKGVDVKRNMNEIYRQLKRFKFCVQGSRYKLGIGYMNVLGVIRRDDSIECFEVQGIRRNNDENIDKNKLYVIIDLDMLYENLSSIDEDIIKVRDGVYNILDKSRNILVKHFERIANSFSAIMDVISKIDNKRDEFIVYNEKLKYMIHGLDRAEKKAITSLNEVYTKKGESGSGQYKSMQNDISKAHLRKKLEDELEQISNMKKEVYICSNDTKSDMDNFILVSDRGLFDSIVMLNNVSKNLEEIQKLK
jgi:hypothetical protein